MSAAFEKNRKALENVLGDNGFAELIASSRIGIWSEKDECQSGILISKMLGELLGRFWQNIDTDGSYSDVLIEHANASSKSCQLESNINNQWSPPYDFVISIGTILPKDAKNGVAIGADGWNICANQNVRLSGDSNPVGPFCAAALASSEAFKMIFGGSSIADQIRPMPQNFSWTAWFGNGDAPPRDLDLHFEEMHVFGVGAVSHGFLWILKNWPHDITGTIHLIDPDNYDVSNAQRYLGMSMEDWNKPKVEQMAKNLKQCHPDLNVKTHHKDMNQYFMDENPGCNVSLAIAGLDSVEGRRQLALKLPKSIVNMWTFENHVGASRFSFEGSWPCLYCRYSEEKQESPDETSMIFREFNKALPPSKIRELLSSGQLLSSDDAVKIGGTTGVEPDSITGRPIRSVRGDICSTMGIQLPRSSTEEQVPFVFASGLAGLGGFVETAREIWQLGANPGAWQMSVLKYPTSYSWQPEKRSPGCYLCSDPCAGTIIQTKYG